MMNKKVIFLLLGLALIFFIGALIGFLNSGSKNENDNPILVPNNEKIETTPGETIMARVKVFFLTEDAEEMLPLSFDLEFPPIREERYRRFVELLLKGSPNAAYIAPIPEGISLRTLYYVEKKEMLVLDFNEELLAQFPNGSATEFEFIYYFVNNICFNFKEVKMVQFMIAGNEYPILTGHIDFENPFYPEYRYIKNE